MRKVVKTTSVLQCWHIVQTDLKMLYYVSTCLFNLEYFITKIYAPLNVTLKGESNIQELESYTQSLVPSLENMASCRMKMHVFLWVSTPSFIFSFSCPLYGSVRGTPFLSIWIGWGIEVSKHGHPKYRELNDHYMDGPSVYGD